MPFICWPASPIGFLPRSRCASFLAADGHNVHYARHKRIGTASFAVDRTVPEKASLATLKGAIYQRVVANAANPHSMGAQIYRIPSRRARASLLPLMAIPAALMLIKHWRYLLRGGSFAVVAHPIN